MSAAVTPARQSRSGSVFGVSPMKTTPGTPAKGGRAGTAVGGARHATFRSIDSTGSPSPTKQRAHTPHVNRRSVVTDFGQKFAAVQHATGSLLHYENGRTVGHNLKRLPSPKPNHDFATSILLGGNHPQNKFRHMNKSFRRTVDAMTSNEQQQRPFSRNDTIPEDSGFGSTYELQTTDGSPASPLLSEDGLPKNAALEYQQRCKEEEHFERDMMRIKVRQRRVSLEGAGNLNMETSFLIGRSAPLTASQQHQQQQANRHLPPRAQTPGGLSMGASIHSRPSSKNGGALNATTASSSSLAGTISDLNGTQSRRPQSQMSQARPASQQTAVGSRPNTRQSTTSTVGGSKKSKIGGADIVPAFLRPKQKTWEELQEFSLNINGDYDSPFVGKEEKESLDNTDFLRKELVKFDARETAKQQYDANEQFIQTLSTLPQNSFTPPKIILMMFKFTNVRNLHSTKAMRKIGYPELHEQFSTIAKNGIITKSQYFKVLNKYLSASEMLDAAMIIQCFDRNALGDVDLNMFLIGLQILLDCATPGDTMRYCFTLMDANNKIPRYITRYEVQTLVGYANESAQSALGGSAAAAHSSKEEVRIDSEFEKMNKAIAELLEEAHRYDYMGRMPLREFLEALSEKVKAAEQAVKPKGKRRASVKPKITTGNNEKGEFVFGSAWQGAPVVAAVHRMSSKKMLYASLAPQHNPSDPHARGHDD